MQTKFCPTCQHHVTDWSTCCTVWRTRIVTALYRPPYHPRALIHVWLHKSIQQWNNGIPAYYQWAALCKNPKVTQHHNNTRTVRSESRSPCYEQGNRTGGSDLVGRRVPTVMYPSGVGKPTVFLETYRSEIRNVVLLYLQRKWIRSSWNVIEKQ